MLNGSRAILLRSSTEYGKRLLHYYSAACACKQTEAQQGRVKCEQPDVLVIKVSSALSGIGFPPPNQSSVCSSPDLSKHLAFFKSIDIHTDGFFKIISAYPHALLLDPDTQLKLSIAHLEAAVGKGLLTECILSWPALLGLGFPLDSEGFGIAKGGLEPMPQGLGSRSRGLACPQDESGLDSVKDNSSSCGRARSSSQEAPYQASSSTQDSRCEIQGLLDLAQQEFSGKVNCLLKCGFKRNSKELAKALVCVLHKSNRDLDAIVRALMSLGLSCNHAGRLIKLQPPILRQKPTEIIPKLDYILNTLGFSTEDLFKHSSFMLYDLELHIRPRYLMHEWIKSKRFLRRTFKLDYIMSMSEREFMKKFVNCHHGGVDMYQGFIRNPK